MTCAPTFSVKQHERSPLPHRYGHRGVLARVHRGAGMSGIPGWARIGAKVVCVDVSNRPGCKWVDGEAPILGGIYTIDRTYVTASTGEAAADLREIKRSALAREMYGDDAGYGLHRFRPLITQQDDIATHFKALLDVPEQVGA
jgi:hypothetical protein